MGDRIEITSWPKHHYLFYRVTSSALMFDVSAAGNAVVGLARKPGAWCDYWICIGDNNSRCWIKKDGEVGDNASTPHILSLHEFRRFWIRWSGDNIQVGSDGEAKPIVSYHSDDNMHELHYITFTVHGNSGPVNWKLDLPPLLQTPRRIRTISGGKPCWVEAEHQLPDGAMIGGFEKETLYIIRAFHRGSLTPGKFVPSEGTGYIPWGGAANDKEEFEVLCGFDCVWLPTWENRIPVGAVEGGYSEEHHERLYVGRAIHEGHLIPGKIQPSHKVCYIPYEGKEIGKKTYEVLVEPNANNRCVNKILVSNAEMVQNVSDDDGSVSWHDNEDDDNQYDSNDENLWHMEIYEAHRFERDYYQ